LNTKLTPATKPEPVPLAALLDAYQRRVNQALDRYLPSAQTSPESLHQAMRYSVMAEGKRIRPVLVYATGEALDVGLDNLDAAACAVEIVHAYSLIHDDLPAMDDDDLRRGRPTCHVKYDEATAILAGDALQALAFEILAKDGAPNVHPQQRLEMVSLLAAAAGSQGMAGGQAIDLASVGKQLAVEELEYMHLHKTGALIRASVTLGALAKPDIERQLVTRLDEYARCIGLAFQVQDDILDVEGNTDTIGKPQGSDEAQNKPTYPMLLGLDGAKRVCAELHQQALEALQPLGDDGQALRLIADYIVSRNK
jgi:geranylgeranyl pyrophosphate synthase